MEVEEGGRGWGQKRGGKKCTAGLCERCERKKEVSE